jgi:hypothetical protein
MSLTFLNKSANRNQTLNIDLVAAEGVSFSVLNGVAPVLKKTLALHTRANLVNGTPRAGFAAMAPGMPSAWIWLTAGCWLTVTALMLLQFDPASAFLAICRH